MNTELSFEEALEKLKEASEKIKDPDTRLADSLQCYEEGMQYYQICSRILTEARQKIETYSEE
ncbi:MAG: exodeoxyribonuclease VII small subunit [Eubacterium sp.]|nr:exodeoxyribonuclease VII small subunit [Eubacterium sp.]